MDRSLKLDIAILITQISILAVQTILLLTK